MIKATITYKEIEPPDNRYCCTGHVAPEKFKRNPNGEKEPTKFFHVTGDERFPHGVYCEPCLIIANFLAKQK